MKRLKFILFAGIFLFIAVCLFGTDNSNSRISINWLGTFDTVNSTGFIDPDTNMPPADDMQDAHPMIFLRHCWVVKPFIYKIA